MFALLTYMSVMSPIGHDLHFQPNEIKSVAIFLQYGGCHVFFFFFFTQSSCFQ